jgi:hypothetical protein
LVSTLKLAKWKKKSGLLNPHNTEHSYFYMFAILTSHLWNYCEHRGIKDKKKEPEQKSGLKF